MQINNTPRKLIYISEIDTNDFYFGLSFESLNEAQTEVAQEHSYWPNIIVSITNLNTLDFFWARPKNSPENIHQAN